VRPKKKLKPLEGQTQLSFAKRPEASKHQEQDTETAIEKDDAKANEDNEESAQAKSVNLRNKDYLSHGSKYICGWSTRKMEIICTAKSAWGLIQLYVLSIDTTHIMMSVGLPLLCVSPWTHYCFFLDGSLFSINFSG